MSVTGIWFLHAVRLRQTTVRTETWEETVLQVDHRLSDFFISGQQVVIIDRNLQVFVLWEETWEFKHPVMVRREAGWEEIALDSLWRKLLLFQNTNKQMFSHINITFQILGLWCLVNSCLGRQQSSFPKISLYMDHTEYNGKTDTEYYQVTIKRYFYLRENQMSVKKKKPPLKPKNKHAIMHGFSKYVEIQHTLYTHQ